MGSNEPMYLNSFFKSLSPRFDGRKRFVGRNNRTIGTWQNYFCIKMDRSRNAECMLRVPHFIILSGISAIFWAPGSVAKESPEARPKRVTEAPAPPPNYADIADLVVRSPMIVDATIRSSKQLKGVDAAGVPAGSVRFLVSADVISLLRGTDAIPSQIRYIVDSALDAQGRPPKLRKAHVLLFARPVSGAANQVQLTGNGAQRVWSPALDALARTITSDLVKPDAPPVITGIGNAFHVPGSLPGEGETQIFLTTADNRPESLNVIRRPGEMPIWAVAQSEIIDEASAPPQRNTLLWYRLACFLPRQLPARSLAADDANSAAAARADYQYVLDALGPCGRTTQAAGN